MLMLSRSVCQNSFMFFAAQTMCLKADPKLQQEKFADLCSKILKRDLRICKLFGGFMLPRFSKMLRF